MDEHEHVGGIHTVSAQQLDTEQEVVLLVTARLDNSLKSEVFDRSCANLAHFYTSYTFLHLSVD